jgi:hypothetical protein
VIYLDTSAAVKALIDEEDTERVRALFAHDEEMISSRLLALELHAVVDHRSIASEAARELIDSVALVTLDDDTLDRAIQLHSGLRSFDALHLAAAQQLGDLVTSMLTFDRELADAAVRVGIPLHPLGGA